MLEIITNMMQGNILSPSLHVCGPPAYLILSPSSAVVFVLCRLIYIEKVHVSIRTINIHGRQMKVRSNFRKHPPMKTGGCLQQT